MLFTFFIFLFLEGESKDDFTKGFIYKIGSQLNMFENLQDQKYFQTVALQAEHARKLQPYMTMLHWSKADLLAHKAEPFLPHFLWMTLEKKMSFS